MNKRTVTLSTRIMILVFSAVLITAGLICVASLIQSSNAVKNAVRQRMLDIANCASASVNGDVLKNLTSEDYGTEDYQKVYDTLAIYRDSVEMQYIYAIRDDGNEHYSFILDTDPVNPGEYGEGVEYTDALSRAAKGKADVDDKPYTDQWGTFYSAYSPVLDSDGNVAGIIGIDFNDAWYEGYIKTQNRKSLVTSIIVLAFTLVFVGIICCINVKSISAPIKHMTEVAEHYEQGVFSEGLQIEREDEIGVLSRALDGMATSLTEQIEVAKSANRAKSAFLANMSHEIRTPINAILGLNEIMIRETDDENMLNYAKDIKTAGVTLMGIVNDVLDISKIESGKLEIINGDYNVVTLIKDLENVITFRAEEKGLSLTFDIDSNIPKRLNGDEVRIKQIITNILSNAVKYTEKGGVTLKISYDKIDGNNDNIILNVSVTDTGIGIKSEDMNRLFSKFERIDEKRNRNIEGTGLGMSITENLLKMMGSSLEVFSVPDEGSTFSFALEQKVVNYEPIGDYESAYKKLIKEIGKYKESFTAPDSSILVVDDNAMNLKVFEKLVAKTQVNVTTADSGDEAVRLSKEQVFDIIFLDHMMPNKDGIETLHDIRNQQDNPNRNTTVVCLTANAISGARDEYLKEGFDDYLSKPVNPGALEAMMKRMILGE